jgi:hypothetical protein
VVTEQLEKWNEVFGRNQTICKKEVDGVGQWITRKGRGIGKLEYLNFPIQQKCHSAFVRAFEVGNEFASR